MDTCGWEVYEKPCAQGSRFLCLPSPKDTKEDVGWNLECTLECTADEDCEGLGRCIDWGPGSVLTCVPDDHWAATYFKEPRADGSCNDGQVSGCAGKCNYACADGLNTSCPYDYECREANSCGSEQDKPFCDRISPWYLGDGPPSSLDD